MKSPSYSTFIGGNSANAVARSTNSGLTWGFTRFPAPTASSRVVALLIDPVTPSTIYAGLFTGVDTGGIHKSTDGGESWEATELVNISAQKLGRLDSRGSELLAKPTESLLTHG